MSIIDASSFTGELQIANTSDIYISQMLQGFINKYEPKFLKQLFGDAFYTLFIENQSDQRFADLINDTELKNAIASYVYYYYIRNQVTQTVGIGNVETKGANSTLSGAGRKQVRAFNEMVCNCYSIIRYITESGLYPEYVEPQWLVWRMSLHGWWRSEYYYYGRGWDVPDIFCSITESNI